MELLICFIDVFFKEDIMIIRKQSFYEKYVKRLLDIICAILALVVFSWLYILVAILVRVKIGKPIIFKQQRPGRINNKTGKEELFYLYKFRTMTNERDEKGQLLPDTKRLTKFGRLLRATSLDELPEAWNILKGDMSVVGPRPLAVQYIPYYTDNERKRHLVRPGLSGWAQVNGRNSIKWEEKFKYDIEYIENISFIFDIKIILLTVKKVFVKEGIGQGEQHPGSLHELRSDWLDENGKIKEKFNH